MAALVRDHDWSRTPLGPAADWTPALQTAVGICLGSRFPMMLWWGPDLTFIYNDGYAPMLGKRHPSALGCSGKDVWADVWPAIRPQVEAVLARGESTWNERVPLQMERNGVPEEAWFTWSYSPIPDGRGGIGGMFNTCREDTGQVLAERERDRLFATIDAERANLAAIVGQAPAFICIFRGPEHVYERANDLYFDLIGRRDVIGKPVRAALPELEGQGFFEILDDVYRTGTPFVGKETPFVPPGGGPAGKRFLTFVYQPIRGDDRAVSGIFIHGVDVTDRMRDMRRLRRSEQHYRALATSSSDVAYRLSADWSVMLPLDGRNLVPSADEPVGDWAWLHRNVPADEHPRVRAAIAAATAGKALFELEHRVNRPDGSTGWTLSRAVPIVDDAGHIAEWFGAASDITDRKRAEAALRDSEERRRLALESAELGAWNIDLATFGFTSDERFQMIFAGTAGAMTYDEAFALIHPEDAAAVRDEVAAAIRAAAPRPYAVEYRVVRPDGSSRWVFAKGRANFVGVGPDRRATSFDGTVADVTDRKRAEVERERLLAAERAARSEAELAGRVKDEFLATLSHELRTPLNAILGWSQIVRRTPGDAAAVAEALSTIERNARAQAQIIDDLLDMSRIISGKVSLNPERLNLSAVVRAAIETVRATAAAKGVGIVLDEPPDPHHPVLGDVNRLQQVFWNLLSNAVKFTPKGGVVRAGIGRRQTHWQVEVTDSGEGIAADFLPLVFDRFRQQDASTTRRHGGLGLGLAIVKQLVELHGGSVAVASEGKGAGSRFTVVLPVDAAPAGSAPRSPDDAAARDDADPLGSPAVRAGMGWHPTRDDLRGVTVLVVDDEADARRLLARLLEESGSRVLLAANGDDAVAIVRTERPEVLVSDIGMPNEDGYGVLARVRRLGAERGGSLPAVALTAYARAEDRVKAIRAGFQMHVPKPVEPSELVTVIASLIRRSDPK